MLRTFMFSSLLLCGVYAAEQDLPPIADPFAGASADPFAVALLPSEVPAQVRVSLQWIEMPQPALTELLGGEDTSGSAMHAKAITLVKDGKAKIVETTVVTGQSGRKFTIESIREEIFPTEYEPPRAGCAAPSDIIRGKTNEPVPPRNLRTPTAFQTRNTGSTLDVEPVASQDSQLIDLRFTSEIVKRVRTDLFSEYHDQWGDASLRMPVYGAWRANTTVTLTSGQFELVSVIHPKPLGPSPALASRILVFVRADVIASPK